MKIALTILGFMLAYVAISQRYEYPSEVTDQMFEHYKKLNDTETRLSAYKDDDPTLKAKLEQLVYINKFRKRFKVQPLKLDIFSSRLANRSAKEASENRYMGHWNLAGEKPYHRYALAGGKHHIMENTYAEWIEKGDDFEDTSLSAMKEKMKEGHDQFMRERAPYDGHKKTIVNAAHNHVGIGVYMNGKQFTYYEEFVDKYLEIETSETEVSEGASREVKFKLLSEEDYELRVVMCTYEREPREMSASKINKTGSYMDGGKPYKNLFDLAPSAEGWYTAEFEFKKPGYYYVQVVLTPKSQKLKRKLDAIYASGVVFVVE